MSRPIGVYYVIVFQRQHLAAFQDALLLGISRILAFLAGSSWIITPGLQGTPSTLQAIAVRKYRSRKIIYWGHKPEDWQGKARWNHIKLVETEFTPPYQRMPPRSFVMPCRSLCGLDLKRIHTTCWLHCRIRKVYYEKLSRVNELKAVWSIAPGWPPGPNRLNIFSGIRPILFKRIALIMEAAGS